MGALKVSAILLATLLGFVAQSSTAPLNVLVDGVPSNRTQFCVQEIVTFICTVPSIFHGWNVSGIAVPPTITPSNTVVRIMIADNTITFALVNETLPNDSNSLITSSLSFTVFPDIDARTISCSAFSFEQTITVSVLGFPSAPSVSAKGRNNFVSFDIIITPPVNSAECVLKYNLTYVESNRTSSSSESVNISSSGVGTVGGLNLCKYNYTFKAFGTTASTDGIVSNIVDGEVNFSDIAGSSMVNVSNGIVQWTILISLPPECYSNYSLEVFECMIESFAILPEIFRSDDTIGSNSSLNTSGTSPTNNLVGHTVTNRDTIDVGVCINATVHISITNVTEGMPVMLFSTSSTSSTPLSNYQCNISVNSGIVEAASSEMITCNDRTTDTTMLHTTIATPPPHGPRIAFIVGVVCGILVLLLLLLVVFIVLLLYIKAKHNKDKATSQNAEPTTGIALQYNMVAQSDEKPDGEVAEYDIVTHGNQQKNGDNLPTYQVPESIKRQAAGTSGDIYTLPDKKDMNVKAGKGGNGGKATEELPMYSMPDKSKKQQNQGLVYADIDVKNPSAAVSRSRPPPQPPGFMIQQESGLVSYSSIQPRNN